VETIVLEAQDIMVAVKRWLGAGFCSRLLAICYRSLRESDPAYTARATAAARQAVHDFHADNSETAWVHGVHACIVLIRWQQQIQETPDPAVQRQAKMFLAQLKRADHPDHATLAAKSLVLL